MREIENGDPLVALAEYCPSVRVLREAVIPYLRLPVAEMLESAARSLPGGLGIGVIDAWRPFARQVRIYEWMWRSHVEAFGPDVPFARRRREVNRFVAPVDQKAPPGHTTGAAVDVWLIDAAGEQLDTTSPYDRLEGAPTFVYGLTSEAERNRMMLYEAMVGAGFSNCRDEWWHYSYGDAGWAVRAGEASCPYGKVDLAAELYRRQEELWLESLAERPNPWLALAGR